MRRSRPPPGPTMRSRSRGSHGWPNAAAKATMAPIEAISAAAKRASPAAVGHLPEGREHQAESEAGQDAVDDSRAHGSRARRPGRIGSAAVETSQIAGMAQAMPIQVSEGGRSPVSTPTATGTSAAPTAESGATTPMRPGGQPAVQEGRPAAGADAGKRSPQHVGRCRVAPMIEQGGARRRRRWPRSGSRRQVPTPTLVARTTPPRKSDRPYIAAEARARPMLSTDRWTSARRRRRGRATRRSAAPPTATMMSRASQGLRRVGQRLVRPAPPAPRRSAHGEVGPQLRRNRNGVVRASRLETDRSCLRVRFSSLPWYVPSPYGSRRRATSHSRTPAIADSGKPSVKDRLRLVDRHEAPRACRVVERDQRVREADVDVLDERRQPLHRAGHALGLEEAGQDRASLVGVERLEQRPQARAPRRHRRRRARRSRRGEPSSVR